MDLTHLTLKAPNASVSSHPAASLARLTIPLADEDLGELKLMKERSNVRF